MLSLLLALIVFVVNGNEYVKTPHGLRLKKCVHHASSGSIITPYKDYTEIYSPNTGLRKQYVRDQDCIDDVNQLFRSTNTGLQNLKVWVDYAYFPLSNDDNMGNFSSIYNVPATVEIYKSIYYSQIRIK